MAGCLVVSLEGRSGGLALLWNEGVDVSIQEYSKHQIDSIVHGFYSNVDPNLRTRSWDILRSVGNVVREDWIVGGDFNAIVNDVEIDVGRKKARASMEEFKDVMEDLALGDVKMDKRWYTWVNNHERINMVKKRLDRFLISANSIDIVPFLIATVVQQNTYDCDAILLDTVGRKPSEKVGDSRLTFKYDMC
ncbi:hypothetical protein GOBAR_AA07396 [Gossypium barbadense]|uniref:Endonuclease/exonuclease/phosphatase domain-containing protein n=1 Tax=Gossypium barbadense TaxID=3634 RepID=A0A2P5YCF3_GOSBA|nr:hypothetical protein GOBAR_AA07396 [Gossypium barbadense]